MKSMTGFGSASAAARDFKAIIHIKSLNSRFLDLKFIVPSVYAPLEADFKAELQKSCARGQVTVFAERFPAEPLAPVSLDWSRAQALKWKRLYQTAAKDLKITNSLDVSHLMALEGVARAVSYPAPLSAGEKALVKSAFKKAWIQCDRERKREGESLKKDIAAQLQALAVHLSRLKKMNGLQKKKALLSRKPAGGGNDKPDKFDFNEELIRLKEHILHCKQILKKESAAAKKLEFYAQELLREFNTIGSKSSLAASTLEVVEGKFIVERVKELSQNLEKSRQKARLGKTG